MKRAKTRSVFIRLSDELYMTIAAEVFRLGCSFSDRARTLLSEAVALRSAAPMLPDDLALVLCEIYWDHYFGDTAQEAQVLLSEVEAAVALGKVSREEGERLIEWLRQVPGPLYPAIVGRLRDALELVRKHGVSIDEAVVRAGLTA